MEGSKLHHDISNKNSKDSSFPLNYLLSKATGDDYYDDIEQGRSKSRTNSNSNKNGGGKSGNKYNDPVYNDLPAGNSEDNLYETNALLDALNADNSEDYPAPVLDESELLSAVAAKLNGNKNNQNNNNKNSNNLNKIIAKLPKTSVSSKIQTVNV